MHRHPFIWSLATMVFLGQTTAQAIDDDQRQIENRMHDWQTFLFYAGRKMGIHFTIEIATVRPPNIDFTDEQIDGKTSFSSIDDLIATLSTKFPWLAFELDETHRRVVHVVDKRLRGKDGYALERKTDIEFAGTLDQLCGALHRRIDNLYRERGGAIHEIPPDVTTETIVQATNRTARQILTDAVPLSCYSPILWRARMHSDGRDPSIGIDVAFLGLKEAGFGHSRWWWWLDTARERGAGGKPLRCFFTIETIYREPDESECCPIYFADDEKFESPESLVAELTKRVAWLTAVKDAKRPEIIHLIDKELLKVDGYALDRRVDIDYEGTPDGLLLSMEQRAGAGPRRHAGTNSPFSGDAETRIVARAKGKPLREVLTDCIPLERTYDVLWHARTWLRKDGPQTTIDYRFPR